LFGLVGI